MTVHQRIPHFNEQIQSPNTTNLNSFTILFTKSFTKKIKKWEPLNDDIENAEIWAGGIAQRLRTLVYTEDPGSSSSTHTAAHKCL